MSLSDTTGYLKRNKGRTAIVVGYDKLGGVGRFTDLFHQYGYDHVVALVNQPDLLTTLRKVPGLDLVKVDDPLDPQQLFDAAKEHGADDSATPFICIQDRPMFSYVDTWERLNAEKPRPFHVPLRGLVNGRLKPQARACWNESGVDCTKWTVRSIDEGASREWTEIGGLSEICDAKKYAVKPICGMASEAVKVCVGRDLDECVSSVRSFLREQSFFHDQGSRAGVWRDRVRQHEIEFRLYSDVLIEEWLEGNEYTVDGYVIGGKVSISVQQKESRIEDPFFGDGLIVSPPDPSDWQMPSSGGQSKKFASRCRTSIAEFEKFMLLGLKAINLDNWVFHAEVMETKEGLRFVELNPRPAGGLLWLTAGLHLGLDPFEVVLRMHLKNSTLSPRAGWVTGQFPIYARKIGKISEVIGIELAREVPNVQRVDQSMFPGEVITSLNRENYVAFVCIHAPTHAEVRQIAEHVESLIRVECES